MKRLTTLVPVCGLWLLSKGLFLLTLFLTRVSGLSLVDTLQLWDTRWYLQIINQGYQFTSPQFRSTVVFLPLYPLLSKFIGELINNHLAGLLIISNLTSLAGSIAFYFLLKSLYDRQLALRGVALLLFSPLGWVLSLGYSESLFLLLSSSFFWLLIKKKYLFAALLINLLTVTRVFGFIFFLPLWTSLFTQPNKFHHFWGYTFLSSLGLITWYGYLTLNFGQPAVMFTTQQAWQRSFAFFPMMLTYQLIYQLNFLPIYGQWWLWLGHTLPYFIDLGLIAFLVALVWKHRRQLPKIYPSYTAIYFILALSFVPFSWQRMILNPPPTTGAIRFLTLCLPVWFLILTQYRSTFNRIFQTSLVFHVIYLAYYANRLYIP